MSYKSTSPWFRDLDDSEVIEFREWSRKNFNPLTDEIPEIWHPVTQAECYKMVLECIEKGKVPFIAAVV